MIGDMLARIRKEKGMSKTELARLTNINIGHLTHIEKGERNPSHRALKNICKALDVPYQQLMYTYDKTINEDQESYKVINHISYDKVLAIDSIKGFIDCPSNMSGAALAIKINDDMMEPHLKKDSYAYVEFNTPLNSKDIGLFHYQDQIMIRRFIIRRDKLVLRADKKEVEDNSISEKDNFYIIGKIIGSNMD